MLLIRHPLATALLVASAALALLPLVSLAIIALRGDTSVWPHLVAYVLPTTAFNTLALMLGVAMLTALIGVGTAWLVTTYQFPGRDAFLWLLAMPLAFPTYIVAYVYVDLLDAFGPVQSLFRALTGYRSAADYWFPSVRSLPGAILLMGLVLYPYVYLAVRAMFQSQSARLIEAAQGLGAGRLARFRDIALPLARPAVAAGLALAMLEALNDIGLSEYLGVRTLTLTIFSTWLGQSNLPGAAQIAWLLLLVIAAVLALERLGQRRRSFAGHDEREPPQRIALTGTRGFMAATACALPVLLGFGVPFLFLVSETATRLRVVGIEWPVLAHALTTMGLAAVATALTLALGFGAVLAARLVRRPFAGTAISLASLGYAIPGTVLALGLLSPLVAFDEALNMVWRALTGTGVGLLLAGSSAALVIAYVVRFLAIATGFAQTGLARIPMDFDDAARVAGASPARLAAGIHLPLLWPALWGAALLVFVDCLKELPATLLLRPLNVETLSTYIYQFAVRGSFEDGAPAALLIVVAGILPVIRLMRHADGLVRVAALPAGEESAEPDVPVEARAA